MHCQREWQPLQSAKAELALYNRLLATSTCEGVTGLRALMNNAPACLALSCGSALPFHNDLADCELGGGQDQLLGRRPRLVPAAA